MVHSDDFIMQIMSTTCMVVCIIAVGLSGTSTRKKKGSSFATRNALLGYCGSTHSAGTSCHVLGWLTRDCGFPLVSGMWGKWISWEYKLCMCPVLGLSNYCAAVSSPKNLRFR